MSTVTGGGRALTHRTRPKVVTLRRSSRHQDHPRRVNLAQFCVRPRLVGRRQNPHPHPDQFYLTNLFEAVLRKAEFAQWTAARLGGHEEVEQVLKTWCQAVGFPVFDSVMTRWFGMP